jgi:hypothetical protein
MQMSGGFLFREPLASSGVIEFSLLFAERWPLNLVVLLF